MNKNSVGCIIISENTSFIPEILDDNKDFIKFPAVFQEIDRINRNNRAYGDQLITSLNTPHMKEKIRTKNFVGECGHPMATGDLEKDAKRQTYILHNNVSHIITELKVNGKIIEGIVETYNGFKGPDMMGAVRQGVEIGFSLRALGNLTNGPNGIKRVDDEILIISYDWVFFPSYPNAYMKNNNNKSFQDRSIDPIPSVNMNGLKEEFINFEIGEMLNYIINKSDNLISLGESFEFGSTSLNENASLSGDNSSLYIKDNDNIIKCFLEKSLTKDIDNFLLSL